MRSQARLISTALHILLALVLLLILGMPFPDRQAKTSQIKASSPADQIFDRASLESGVPATLLKAICYMEGRLSEQGGNPSLDNGFGCMHLVKSQQSDTLERAARELKVSIEQLKRDFATNIRGGAAILRDYAFQVSHSHSLPHSLGSWYGAVAAYSNATTRSTALLYANSLYKILHQGFSAPDDQGEIVTLAPQIVQPDIVTAASVQGERSLPPGCTHDDKADYPGAIDCILPPHTFDCNQVPDKVPCSYESAQRPNDYAIDQIVIHDIEGTIPSALNVFQNPQHSASAHYLVDSDGTIYQVMHENDIAYHAGNYWYNQHSIGIEHVGFDTTGYRWYNATEYLASAKLVAYLLKKYQLPLDHAHIVSHGTVPAPSSTALPNHVDPGPYWLWDYYLKLIHQQGVPFPRSSTSSHVFTLQPKSDQHPSGQHGTETGANFAFFYLYTGPSTRSARIPRHGLSSDIAEVSGSVEPDMSYYYVAKARDQAGSGATMYQIWYGEEDHAHASKPDMFAHAHLAWLAVPRGAATKGQGTPVTLTTSDGSPPLVYGRPVSGTGSILGDAPDGARFVSAYTVTEDATENLWYEINYNHRQGWVPASEVAGAPGTTEPVEPTQPVPPVSPDPND